MMLSAWVDYLEMIPIPLVAKTWKMMSAIKQTGTSFMLDCIRTYNVVEL